MSTLPRPIFFNAKIYLVPRAFVISHLPIHLHQLITLGEMGSLEAAVSGCVSRLIFRFHISLLNQLVII